MAIIPRILLFLLLPQTAVITADESLESRQPAIVASSLPQRSSPSQVYVLKDGSVLVHHESSGTLDRGDVTGKILAQTKVPQSTDFTPKLAVLLPPDHRHVLLMYTADDQKATARHQLTGLDVETLQTRWTLRMGPCQYAGEHFADGTGSVVALFCDDVPNPSDAKAARELALVTLDMSSGRMLRRLPLGGQRRGMWFGPMFFGYYYESGVLAVQPASTPCPPLEPTVTPPDLPNANIQPRSGDRAFLVRRSSNRRAGFDQWEAWFDAGTSDPPRRTPLAFGRVRTSLLCRDGQSESSASRVLLQVVVESGDPSTRRLGEFRNAEGRTVTVIDVATAQILNPEPGGPSLPAARP